MPYCLCSNANYKVSCSRCNATCYCETCRHLNVRVGEHSGVSPLTFDFKNLETSVSDIHIKVKESVLISRDEPILNKHETSLPLYLFD